MQKFKRKRWISGLMSLAMCIILFPASAFAIDDEPGKEDGRPTVIDTVDNTADNIHINLFDYSISSNNSNEGDRWANQANVWVNGGINSISNLKFYGAGGTSVLNGNGNAYTGSNTARQGIVEPILNENGYPRMNDFTYNGRGQNLDILFSPDANVSNDLRKVYKDVKYLFRINEKGNYYYNSDENYAYFDATQPNAAEGGSFEVYDRTHPAYEANQALSEANTIDSVGFNPFDPYDETKMRMEPSDDLADAGIEGYNHQHGLTIDTEFTIPESRTINGEDIMFSFSGDDDAWLFIDGVLVLDVGGIHAPTAGTVNFTTGEVNVEDAVTAVPYSSDANIVANGEQNNIDSIFRNVGRTWDPAATHTMKFFYLERGGCYSNLAMETNIWQLTTPDMISIPVQKVWADGNSDVDAVEVELIADGEKTGKTITLDAQNDWTNSFYKVPMYKSVADDSGNTSREEINYTVSEKHVDGFYPDYEDPGIVRTVEDKYWVPTTLEKMLQSDNAKFVITGDDWRSNSTGTYMMSNNGADQILGKKHASFKDVEIPATDEPTQTKPSITNVADSEIWTISQITGDDSNVKYQFTNGDQAITLVGTEQSNWWSGSTHNYSFRTENLGSTPSDTYRQFTQSFFLDPRSENQPNIILLHSPQTWSNYVSGDENQYLFMDWTNTQEFGSTYNRNWAGDLTFWEQVTVKRNIEIPQGLTITNVKAGDLSITKDVPGVSSTDTFNFTVTLEDPNGRDLTGTFGDIKFVNGVAKVSVKDGETKTAKDIPAGVKYTVVEEDFPGYIQHDADNATGTISATTPANVTFINDEHKVGDLTIKKSVPDVSSEDVFYFTVTLNDSVGKTLTGTYGDLQFKDGVSEFTLGDDETKTAKDLPAGVAYTIKEKDAKGYILDGSNDVTGTVPLEDTATVTFVNIENKVGNLSVTKDVPGVESTDTFSFTVTLTDDLGKTLSGTYGDITFTNGVAEFTLNDGQTKVARDLPAGVQYKVEETDKIGYVRQDNDAATGTIGIWETSNVVIVNREHKVGSLSITKDVPGVESEDTFTFTVTLTDDIGKTLTGVYGDMTFTNGVAEVSLKDGQTKVAKDLPVGVSYQIEESEAKGYIQHENEKSTGTIALWETTEVIFVNDEHKVGDLRITKDVPEAESEDIFNFTVTLTDEVGKTLNGTYGDLEFSNGVASFTLKDAETKVAKDLPAGVTYVVQEEAAKGYTQQNEGKATGTIGIEEVSDVTIVNDEHKAGDLRITKDVPGADSTDTFSFTITLTDELGKTLSGTYGDIEFTDGVAEFTLKDAETKVAKDLPAGIEYKIIETAVRGYTQKANEKMTGSIEIEETADVVVVNEKVASGGGHSGGGGGGGAPAPKQVTLTYDSNGGTTYTSEKYTVNTKVTLDKLPTKTSYQFTGWYLDKDLKQSATNVVMDKDKTVYAGWKKVSESVLDLENHYAYIIGFPEDYRTGERSDDPSLFPVKPTAPITRAEVTTVFFRMLTDSMREKNWTTSNSYTDVKADHWFNNAVSVMTKLGIVQGVGNDQFKPNAPITRGEMAAIAARFARMMDSTTTTTMSFTDIAGHWAEEDILYAASVGWVKGDTDGSYRPNDKITRAEFMTLANRMLEREPENESDLLEGMITWPDNQDKNAWYYLAVQEATNSHQYSRKEGKAANLDFNYEKWVKLEAVRDWRALETSWSNANSADYNGGEVYLTPQK